MPPYQKILLDQSFNFEKILNVVKEHFGLTFLQDNQHPFIGVLPKFFWCCSKVTINNCLERQEDFTYLPTQKPIELIFNNHSQSSLNGFEGGYVGFISYDYARNSAIAQHQKEALPSLMIGEYDIFIKKESDVWFLYVSKDIQDLPAAKALIQEITHMDTSSTHTHCIFDQKFQPRWSKQEYQTAFQKVQSYLYAGDCYQINLTQEFSACVISGKILSLLPELMELSRAPYAGYFTFDDFELLSCSPELFIEFDRDKLLKTRPIKGTLPRGSNPTEDEKLKQQLADSEKDQAENLMIVDLLRNDLSVYAKTGSVKVPKIFEIESFAQVHHMVSEIHATLKEDVNPFDVLMSALPGGSITGAPKIRAMEIIDEIEGNNRGAYCGSLGYFNYDGTGAFNILIRSIQRYGDDVSVWAGGGITVKSDVDAEYQETLDKVSAILNVLNQYVD